MRQIVLVVHNVRSTHNVGSLLRTADGLGAEKVYLTGYTPYPSVPKDIRLPHLSQKVHRQISKTALGAENSQKYEHRDAIEPLLSELIQQGYEIVALEQAKGSVELSNYKAKAKVALIVGREVEGLEAEILNLVHAIVEIPMLGKKESFNVVQAAAMALYQLRYG